MYNLVVCGGTFDRLHAGHITFLDSIFGLSDRVVIGLTSDQFVRTLKPQVNILSYEKRYNELQEFLENRGYKNRYEIISIDDVYGEAINEKYPFEAIIVTENTIHGAYNVNEKRKELGVATLPVISLPLLSIESGTPLSSTLIRSGKVGRQGQFFPNPKWSKNVLYLPKSVREVLHQPFGTLYKETPLNAISSSEKIISVGDATTKKLLEKGITPKLSIIDFIVERKKVYETVEQLGFKGEEVVYKAHNPAGTLTPEVWDRIEEIDRRLSQSQKVVLEIDGEEDLIVIPLALLLPLGYSILYGQPHEGVVFLEITEDIKLHIFRVLTQFAQKL